jgi:hypothetical protein
LDNRTGVAWTASDEKYCIWHPGNQTPESIDGCLHALLPIKPARAKHQRRPCID